MRPLDAQAKLTDAVPRIDAALTGAKFREYSRFGLPGASSSDGRGGEPPLPLMGRTDRSILRDRNLYEMHLTDAAVALEAALRIQLAWTKPYDGDPDEQAKKDLAGKPCSNVFCMISCDGKKDNKLRNGRCPDCAQFYRRTGNERTAQLCDVTNARFLAGSRVAPVLQARSVV